MKAKDVQKHTKIDFSGAGYGTITVTRFDGWDGTISPTDLIAIKDGDFVLASYRAIMEIFPINFMTGRFSVKVGRYWFMRLDDHDLEKFFDDNEVFINREPNITHTAQAVCIALLDLL